MNKTYAGIGSRETPQEICSLMTNIAKYLSKHRYTLYSGGASGADHAFEIGATYKKIYLPFENFNGKNSDGKEYIVPKPNYNFVLKYHPKPSQLSKKGWDLMSRNSYQVLGDTLSHLTKVDFVICWTEEGKMKGGTSQALRIAKAHKIPIFNLFNQKYELEYYFKNFIE